jgi:hypothetical protein
MNKLQKTFLKQTDSGSLFDNVRLRRMGQQIGMEPENHIQPTLRSDFPAPQHPHSEQIGVGMN